MPITLTLKNIPDVVYQRLKASAERHRRSLNREAIVCLESVLMAERMPAGERVLRARALREGQQGRRFLPEQIDADKRQGRS